MFIDYINKIGPTNRVSCSGPDCPICKITKEFQAEVKLRNLKIKTTVNLSKAQYDIIVSVAREMVNIAEQHSLFDINDGYVWIDIPLTESDKFATLSVRRTKVENQPHYQWMLEK